MISNQSKTGQQNMNQYMKSQVYTDDDSQIEETKQSKMHIQMANTTYDGFGGASSNAQVKGYY